MSTQTNAPYILRFSFNNNRLNVSRAVLYYLEKPQYIQLLISQDRKTMFVKRCEEKERDCFAVPPRVYVDSTYHYVLRKAPFAEAVCLSQSWDKNGKYRLLGTPLTEDVLAFAFADAVRLDA